MKIFPKCQRNVGGSRHVFSDPKGGSSKVSVVIEPSHAKQFAAFDVDGCVLKDGAACDFGFAPHNKSFVFVELKGSDVKRGLQQLEVSIEKLRSQLAGRAFFAVLVPTRCPLVNYEIQKAQERFRAKLACRLKVKNQFLQCSTLDF